jgi:predicted transglutaminase-like cysteine proteinase
VAWRRRRLEAAGFPADLAAALARDHRTDLHAVLGLVDRGCPPALAVRILAPLESP